MPKDGRWGPDDVKGSSKFLRLSEDGDTCRIVFMLDLEDEEKFGCYWYSQHWLASKKQYVMCEQDPLDPEKICKYCDGGIDQMWKMRIPVFDVDAGCAKMLDSMPGMWILDMRTAFEDGEWDPAKTMFKVKREGKKSKTRRHLIPMGPAPEEVLALVAAAVRYTYEDMKAEDKPNDDDPGVTDTDVPF